MNKLLKTRLFNLLTDLPQVTNDEMKNAYEGFVKEIETLNQDDGDYIVIYRVLNITRIELVSLSKQYGHEQGKKCP